MSAVIPQFRNKQLLRQAQVDFRYSTKVLATTDRDLMKHYHTVSKLVYKLELSLVGTVARARAEEKLARARELFQQVQTRFDEAVHRRDETLVLLQAIDALPKEPVVNYVPNDMEEKYSEERSEPAEVSVRMMSGDVFAIEIDLNDKIHFFPKQFAREAGYNPAAVSRMVFFVDGEDEALIDPDLRELGLPRCEHISWKERYSEIPNPDALPMLNIIIRSESEKDRDAKIQLIRQILEQKKLNNAIDDTELFSQYSEWNLRYQPPRITNRYITMSSFIEQNSHLFPVLTEEEMETVKERKAHRDMLMNFHLFRLRELRWVDDNIAAHGDFNLHHLAVQEELHQLVALATEQGAEVVFDVEQFRYFRRWMGIQEIVDIGVRSENICTCPQNSGTCFISNWTRFCTEADAMGLLLD